MPFLQGQINWEYPECGKILSLTTIHGGVKVPVSHHHISCVWKGDTGGIWKLVEEAERFFLHLINV